ncbi:MAG TPA: L-threonylcarbamoyladenylate synthase [Candidatus Eisenbacteria bacterium]|nr:L-threonylcarbamoyladenylate synthase [Candidatus Eisenbacteria bacterium]
MTSPPSASPLVRRVALADPASWRAAAVEAGAHLARGGVALLPAEGLYGFHVRADLPAALDRLQVLKPREPGRGWIVLLAEPRVPAAWGPALDGKAAALAREHWPGALTLVVPAAPDAPPDVLAGDGTVALRCPGSDFLRAVIAAAGGPLVTTSANRPGAPPPSDFESADREGVSIAVDAGPLSGLASTVAQVDGSTVRVLRSGAVRIEGEGP